MATSSTPNFPSSSITRSVSSTKTATPDIIIQDYDSLSPELLSKLILEDVAGQELLLLSRHDTVGGQDVAYRKIENANEVNFRYGADSVLVSSDSFKNYFKNFPILLEGYVPEISGSQFAPNASLDLSTGNIILEFKDIRPGQQIEVQSISSADVFDDIIY